MRLTANKMLTTHFGGVMFSTLRPVVSTFHTMVSPLCALGCPGCGPDAAVQVKESPADPSDDRDREPESSFSQENWQGKKNIVPL